MPGNVTQPRTPLAETILRLRQALSLTQTEFGNRIGVSLPSVQRYEAQQEPQPATLQKLSQLAAEHGLDDYRDVFDAILEKREAIIREDENPVLPIQPRDPQEALLVLAVLRIARRRDLYAKEHAALLRTVENAAIEVQNIRRLKKIDADIQKAMARLFQAGISQEEIARKYKLSDIDACRVTWRILKGLFEIQNETK